MSESMIEQASADRSVPKRGRHILRLSIWMLLIALLAAGGVWGTNRYWQAQQQRQALAQIKDVQGHAYYLSQYRAQGEKEELLDEEESLRGGPLIGLLGKDFFNSIFYVSFAQFRQFQTGQLSPLQRPTITDKELTPLLRLPELRWLALSSSAVTDEGTALLARLPRLERLWLSDTAITDESLQHLAQAQGLTHLFLEGTSVTDRGLEHLSGLPNLRVLSLGNTAVTNEGLRHLAQIESLEALFLDNVPISDAGVSRLANLHRLETLSLQGTQVSGSALGKLPPVEVLSLDKTPIADRGLQHVPQQHLRALMLRGTQVSNAGLQHLDEAKHLMTLDIRQTECTLSGVIRLFEQLPGKSRDDAFAAIAQVQRDDEGNVTSLDLAGIRVLDEDLVHVQPYKQLRWLFLPGSGITDAGLQQLLSLRKLTLLNIQNTHVTDAGLKTLEELPLLRTVHAAGTAVTPAAAKELAAESKMRIYLTDFSQFDRPSRRRITASTVGQSQSTFP